MKRSDFLKKLGIGLGVAMIAPSVVANNATSEEKLAPLEFKPKRLSTNIKTTEELNAVFAADDDWYDLYRQHELEQLWRLQKSIVDEIFLR